jgi:hypothetical protein
MPDVEIALPGGAGTYRLSGRSALAQELMTVNTRARKALLIPDGAVLALDALVVAARLLTDDHDLRPPLERLDDLADLVPDIEGDRIAELANWAQAALLNFEQNRDQIEKRLKRLTSQNFLAAARRMIGAAAYDRVMAAFNSDAAVVTLALRRTLRHIMPLAVAIDDCAAVLSNDGLAEFNVTDLLTMSSLRMLVMLDGLFDNLMEGRFSLIDVTQRVEDHSGLSLEDLEAIAERLHDVIEAQTRADLLSLNTSLARKIQGANDALSSSADAASQAANSMIEFIDRTLRNAFDDEYVLQWIEQNNLKRREFVYLTPEGKKRPTKRGQALCFVCAGKTLHDGLVFHGLAAASLNQARKSLQKIKHTDEGTEAELAEVRDLMRGVLGFITYAVRVGWASASADAVAELRARLASL